MSDDSNAVNQGLFPYVRTREVALCDKPGQVGRAGLRHLRIYTLRTCISKVRYRNHVAIFIGHAALDAPMYILLSHMHVSA